MSKLIAGFGKASIAEAIVREKKHIADALEVRVFATKNSAGEIGMILCSDLGGPEQTKVLKLRAKVAKAIKTKTGNITCNTTQNHSVPGSNCFDYAKLAEAYISAAKMAVANLQPVSISFVSLAPEGIHFNRRPRFGKYGAFTTWFGIRKTEDGEADVSHIAKNYFNSMDAGNPGYVRSFVPKTLEKESYKVSDARIKVPEPLLLQTPKDPLLQAVFFKDAFGEPFGSIIRFAAHPATANTANAGYYSHDFPGYVRERAEERWGGFSMFLLGPTGDQVPFTEKKSLSFAKEYGFSIANLALENLPGRAWVEDGEVAFGSYDAKFAIRKDLPASQKEAQKVLLNLEQKIKKMAAVKGDLAVIKKLTDRYDVIRYLALNMWKEWSGYDIFKLRGRSITHPLHALKLGPVAFLSLPAEPFGEYSTWLRSKTIGDKLIISEEGNGYLCYIPTNSEVKYGNYEANANFFTNKLEKELMEGSLKILRKVLGPGR